MKPRVTEKRQINLVGMDFFGDPFEEEGGWSEGNAIGKLWERFNRHYERKKDRIKHLSSESSYEIWIDFEGEEESKSKYIFVGVEVERIEDVPLEFVAKTLPETRYAVFTLKWDEMKSDWSSKGFEQWIPDAGLEPSFNFLIEYYDVDRFKGMDDPESELDIYVPVR
jgi:AraC family transcriptional regulator